MEVKENKVRHVLCPVLPAKKNCNAAFKCNNKNNLDFMFVHLKSGLKVPVDL